MVGKTVLQYQILEQLGSGGMGEVYKAQDTRLNRLVAIKVLPARMASDPERRRRFIQEAQAASALNHPNIITIYDIITEDNSLFMVMEFVAGKTLHDLIGPIGLSQQQVLQYGTQIAEALSVAHSAGIIHRDLKPSNIMITGAGLAKILDFGLAKLTDLSLAAGDKMATKDLIPLTQEGAIIGTVSYMSPEQAESKPIDARSDIFSFGSVLYEMITGHRAFDGGSSISTLSAVLRDEVKPVGELAPETPPLLEAILSRCLAKDPAARWQSMGEVAKALSGLRRQLDSEQIYPAPVITPAAKPISPKAPSTPWPAPLAAGTPEEATTPAPAGVGVPIPPPSPQFETGSTPPLGSTAAAAHPSAGLPPNPPGASSSSKTILIVASFFVVIVLAAGAAAGWWWWTHRAIAVPVQTAQTAPSQEVQTVPAPPPMQPDNSSPTAAQPAEPEAQTPPAVETTAPKRKSSAKQKAAPESQTPTSPQPIPAPQPVTATAEPPKPAARKPAAPPMVSVTVSDALPFRVVLADDVAADAPEGQALRFTAVDGLSVNNSTVIPKGAVITGTVAGETGKKKILGMGGGSKLTFRMVEAQAASGKRLSVRCMSGRRADGPTTRTFETPKASKVKGLAASKGTEYIAYIDGDQTISVRK